MNMCDRLEHQHASRPAPAGRGGVLLGFALLAVTVAAPAFAVDPADLAPVGICAEDERELQRTPPEQAAAPALRVAARMLVRPVQVAASPPARSLRPALGSIVAPGPCDSPGSGCQGPVLPAAPPPIRIVEPEPEPERFVEPEPETMCGFPGCAEPRSLAPEPRR